MKNTVKLLREEIVDLRKAADVLEYSYIKCLKVPVAPGLTNADLEAYEALTSRFARLSDLIIQKVFRTLEFLDLEQTGSVRDRINRAEKKRLIASADKFIEIRTLRNEIAHEYQSQTIFSIFERVLGLTPALLKSIDSISLYADKYLQVQENNQAHESALLHP